MLLFIYNTMLNTFIFTEKCIFIWWLLQKAVYLYQLKTTKLNDMKIRYKYNTGDFKFTTWEKAISFQKECNTSDVIIVEGFCGNTKIGVAFSANTWKTPKQIRQDVKNEIISNRFKKLNTINEK